MWEHVCDKHENDSEEVQFGYEVISRHPGDALTRQLEEVFKISSHIGISLNDKDEWVRPASIRVRGESV